MECSRSSWKRICCGAQQGDSRQFLKILKILKILEACSRHNFKKSLKSAASLIFAIKRFTQRFKRVEALRRGGGAPVGARLRLGFCKTVRRFKLPGGLAADTGVLGSGHARKLARHVKMSSAVLLPLRVIE